jgi:streptomycin 6-kinase
MGVEAKFAQGLIIPELAERWMRVEGVHAKAWLKALPRIAIKYASQRDLEIEGPLAGGSMAVVLAAHRQKTGEKVVTKFQPPWHEDLRHQAIALETWNGECAPKLFDASEDYRILTMERIHPGVSETLEPAQAADVIAEYSSYESDKVPQQMHLTLIDRFIRSQENRSNVITPFIFHTAVNLVTVLAASSGGKNGLLHGDFSDKNVLSRNGRRVVIDPIPATGDIAYDAAKWAIAQPTGINERCRRISKRLGIDEERTILWAHGLAVAEAGLSSEARAHSTILSLGRFARRAGCEDVSSYLHACTLGAIPAVPR